MEEEQLGSQVLAPTGWNQDSHSVTWELAE
jgi:hypothetical protein